MPRAVIDVTRAANCIGPVAVLYAEHNLATTQSEPIIANVRRQAITVEYNVSVYPTVANLIATACPRGVAICRLHPELECKVARANISRRRRVVDSNLDATNVIEFDIRKTQRR